MLADLATEATNVAPPAQSISGVATTPHAQSLDEKFAAIQEHWRPKTVAELNGQELHQHDDADELFLVWRGKMTIEFRDRRVTLRAGEFCVVPRGVEHCTVAESEAEVLLFESANTRNTGNVADE